MSHKAKDGKRTECSGADERRACPLSPSRSFSANGERVRVRGGNKL